jgi:hypothetical protein
VIRPSGAGNRPTTAWGAAWQRQLCQVEKQRRARIAAEAGSRARTAARLRAGGNLTARCCPAVPWSQLRQRRLRAARCRARVHAPATAAPAAISTGAQGVPAPNPKRTDMAWRPRGGSGTALSSDSDSRYLYLNFFERARRSRPTHSLCLYISRKDENATEISRIGPHRFLYFIRSNSYFCVRLYRFCFCFRISNVKVENGLDIFRLFPTIFYFSTFNSEYPEFKIQFKPNFVVNHYCPGN